MAVSGDELVARVERLADIGSCARPDVWDHHLVGDTSRIRRELGYREVDTREEGLRRTLAWYAESPAPDPKTAANLDYEAEDAALVTIRGTAVH